MTSMAPTITPAAESAKKSVKNGGMPGPELSVDEIVAQVDTVAGPTAEPPAEIRGVLAGAAASTWTNNHKIAALWGSSEPRNIWAFFDGLGWKKLSNARDSATLAFTILAAHARQTQTPYVNGREEADGMIHELYVW